MSLWIELTFCMLTVMQRFFIRPTLYCISLTFKCQSTAVVLVGLLAVAGMVLGNNVCPSFCPAVFLGVFETGLLRFSEFWHGGKNPQVVRDNQIFSKNFNFPKKNEEMCQKKRFFEFIFILFVVFLHKSYVWEKSYSWDKGQNALSQSD